MNWIQNNIGTIAVALVLAVVLGLIAYKLVRDKKAGKSTCGCGCSGCAMRGSCHGETKKE